MVLTVATGRPVRGAFRAVTLYVGHAALQREGVAGEQMLLVVADRRATQDLGRQIATTATNLYDFRLLFNLWAGICTTALGELKAASPIPKTLQPNQQL